MSTPRHEVRFPGESPSYRAARNKLLDAEIEVRRAVEAVAAQRESEALADGWLVVDHEDLGHRLHLGTATPPSGGA